MFKYDNKVLGKVIRKKRYAKGISQEVLSSFACISQTHLSRIENGRKNPNVETVCKIAYALDMKPHELFKILEEEMENSPSKGRR